MIIKDIDKYIIDNNITKIYLDFDGVISHTCQAIVNILNKKNKTNFNGSDVISWNFKEIDSKLDNNTVEKIFDSDEFFIELDMVEGAKEFINKYKDMIIIITTSSRKNLNIKHHLLEFWGLNNVDMIGIPIGISKSIINMSNGLFIDDNYKNLIESNAMHKIQFREYNDNKIRKWINDWNGDVMYEW